MNLFSIGTFIFFTLLVAFLSWKLTKDENLESNTGYFLGGRSLSGVVIAGSLLLTNLSTEQLVGMNAQAFNGGLSVVAWEVISGLTLVFMALYFLPRYLKSGFTTIPEFLEERYDKGTRNIVAILFLISLGVIFLPVVLYSGGIALNSLLSVKDIFNVSEGTALMITIWGIGIIGGIYAVFGGLKAVAVSDTLNGVGLILGGILIPILGFFKMGDGNVIKGIENIFIEFPEKINVIGTSNSPVPFSTIFTGIILINTFYWCTNQSIVQRAFGAKSLKEGQKGVLHAGILKIFVPMILAVPGLIALSLYSSEISHPDMAYPLLVNKLLPKPLIGFFGAVLFGAVLSSFNSALNSASTLFCLNIYKPIFNSNIKDKDLVKVGKIFGIILGLSSILVAPYIANAPDGLFAFMKKFMGFFNVPTLVIVLVGFFSKRIPPIAAKISLFVFMTIYGVTQFVYKINIHFLHLLGILFVLCVAIMIIIGKLFPMKTEYKQTIKNDISFEAWKYANSFSGVTVVFLVYFYVLFSHYGIIGIPKEEIFSKFIYITLIFTAISLVTFKMLLSSKKVDTEEIKELKRETN